jgi:23S rRNA pseudouridine2605 synthase
MSQERLQKILARAGIASRRAAEAMISAGRVKVDGRTIRELGTQADPEAQRIEVDGRRVGSEPLQYLVLHKPREVVSTLNDPVKRHTVMELVAGAGARVVPVGRLDYHTSGVLLFSNDGQFSRTLLHPSSGVPRQYVLKVKGPVEEGRLERLRDRIVIDGRRTQPADVLRERNEGDKVWLLITLREGRNRHVRRLAEHAGFQVMRLARLSFAGISAEGLAPGQWRALTRDELSELQRLYGVPKELPAGVGTSQERVEGSPVRMRTRVAQAERALRPSLESEDDDAGEDERGPARVLPHVPADKARRGAGRPPLRRSRASEDSSEQAWSKPARRAAEPHAARRRTGADTHSSEQSWSKPARGAAKPFRAAAARTAAAPYANKQRAGADSGEQAWGKPARGAGKPVRGAGKPGRAAAAPYAKPRRADASEQPRGKPARGAAKASRGAAAPYAKARRAGADASEQPWGKPARGAAKPYRGTAAPYAKKRGAAPDARSFERSSGTSGPRAKKRGAAKVPSPGSGSARPRGKQSRPSSRRGPP